jgi:hypothetical protein
MPSYRRIARELLESADEGHLLFFLGGVKVRPECLGNITQEAFQIEDEVLWELRKRRTSIF